MKILGDFNFNWLKDGINMELLNDLIYIDKYGQRYIVQKGEVTDGSSIPRILWTFAKSPFVGKHKFAAVLHDYLYRMGKKKESPVNRKRADELFYEGMIEFGVKKREAKFKYLAVRWLGPRW